MLASNNKQDGGHVHLRHTTNVYWLVNEADKKRSELMAPTSSIGRLIRYYSSVLEQQQIVLIEQYIVEW